ncbi:MAG: 23S rRNA (guanosine(2251)-2'-O)-methyltransferase RlmB [Parasutterella excrementihominis]
MQRNAHEKRRYSPSRLPCRVREQTRFFVDPHVYYDPNAAIATQDDEEIERPAFADARQQSPDGFSMKFRIRFDCFSNRSISACLHIDDNLAGNPLLLLLDGVTDPRNFGACLRVADAAGVSAVITPKDRSATLTAAAVKASAGASETVPIVRVTNLAGSIAELVDAGVPIIGTAGEAQKTIYEFDQKGAFGWVLGAEGDGLRQLTRRRCSDLAKIPMLGTVESLNVSVAAGICLFETVRQRTVG